MKRNILILCVLFCSLLLVSCGGSGSSSSDYDLGSKDGLTAFTKNYFESTKAGTVTEVTVNDDAGTGSGYILLVNVEYPNDNAAEVTKKSISSNSDLFATKIETDAPDVNQLVIFWDVPTLEGQSKQQYERSGSAMSKTSDTATF